MTTEALHLLSIARKGRMIEAGEEPVVIACRGKHARLVIVASDAGDHIFRRVQSLTAGTRQPWIKVDCSKDDLGVALGYSAVAVAALTDVSLALAFVKALKEPVKYEALQKDLEERVARVEQRRKEEKAHRANVKKGKKK